MNITDQAYARLREPVDAALKTRGHKYRVFLAGSQIALRALIGKERTQLMERYYVAMRFLDDAVDGDMPYEGSAQHLIEERLHFLKCQRPRLDIDIVLRDCCERAESLRLDIVPETKAILKSLLFDARRKGKHLLIPEKELVKHFYDLDIRGTIGGYLQMFCEPREKTSVLEPLGVASRIVYNLRDFREDLAAGFVNIPKETYERLGIMSLDQNDAGVQQWFHDEQERGLAAIVSYHKNREATTLDWRGKQMAYWFFERPAQRWLTKNI